MLSLTSVLDELPRPVEIPGVGLCFPLLTPSFASNHTSSALCSCFPLFALCFVGWFAVSSPSPGVAMVCVPQLPAEHTVLWGALRCSGHQPSRSFLPIPAGWLRKLPKEQMPCGVSSTHKPSSVLFVFVLISSEKEVTIYK